MPDLAGGMLTSDQAADILGVSKATVLRATRVGSLASTGTAADGEPLFSRDAVELYRRRRTELFRGAVRSGAQAGGAKSAAKAAEAAIETAESAIEAIGVVEAEPEVPEPEAASLSEPELLTQPAPKPVLEAETEPVPEREALPAQRTARRQQVPPTTLAEISREEWLEDWTTTLEWLDRVALSLSPIEGGDPGPAPRAYEPRAYEPRDQESSDQGSSDQESSDQESSDQGSSDQESSDRESSDRGRGDPEARDREVRGNEANTAEDVSSPHSPTSGSESVNLAVRPVVSFAILKEIGLALRARPGVLEARLDRLDSGAAWFVLRHDGSVPLESSVSSALHPLGFSANRSGDDSFEVVQDSSAHTA